LLIKSQQEVRKLQKKVLKLERTLNVVAMANNNKEKDCDRLEVETAKINDLLF